MTVDLKFPPNKDIHLLQPCRTLFEASEFERPSNRTFIVLGSGRGGTSMVAGAMSLLGISMNQSGIDVFDNRYNAEDIEFTSAFQGKPLILDDELGWKLGDKQSTDICARYAVLRSLVEKRNKSLEVWGFKDPSAYMYLNEIKSSLINPHLIIVYRDLLAIAEREWVTNSYPIEHGLLAALDRYTKIQDLAFSWRVPTLFISFERSKLMKKYFVRMLADFVGVEPAARKITAIRKFISGDSYKAASDYENQVGP